MAPASGVEPPALGRSSLSRLAVLSGVLQPSGHIHPPSDFRVLALCSVASLRHQCSSSLFISVNVSVFSFLLIEASPNQPPKWLTLHCGKRRQNASRTSSLAPREPGTLWALWSLQAGQVAGGHAGAASRPGVSHVLVSPGWCDNVWVHHARPRQGSLQELNTGSGTAAGLAAV